jgi:hypothetical protein
LENAPFSIKDARSKRSRDRSSFSNVVPAWFYLIAKHFLGRTDDESFWGGETGALLLSHMFNTLSCIVVSGGAFTPAIDLIAMDFFRLVWAFKDAETPDIRASVTDAARVVIQVASDGLKLQLLSDSSVDGLHQSLSRALEADPDERCRISAAATIQQVIKIVEENERHLVSAVPSFVR